MKDEMFGLVPGREQTEGGGRQEGSERPAAGCPVAWSRRSLEYRVSSNTGSRSSGEAWATGGAEMFEKDTHLGGQRGGLGGEGLRRGPGGDHPRPRSPWRAVLVTQRGSLTAVGLLQEAA